MAYTATLDACVLYSMPVCDTLLRLADDGFYRPVWSGAILHELVRTMVRRGKSGEQAARRRTLMEESFPAAKHTFEKFLPVVPEEVDPGDRHVVAVALASKSDVIVTDNLKHFAADQLLELGIAVQDAGEFLLHQASLDEERFKMVLDEQCTSLATPITIDDLLERFRRYPAFFDLATEKFGNWRIPELEPVRVRRVVRPLDGPGQV